MNRKVLLISIVLVLAISLIAIGYPRQDPRFGGTVKHAIIGNPPTLDVQWTTAAVTHYTMWHVFEPLFTFDATYSPIPHLVDTYSVSEDGLTWTFNLRRGVLFHNGKEMVSEDVIASLQRWGQLAAHGRTVMAMTESITAKDEYTVIFKLKDRLALLPLYLASVMASVYPKEVIDEVGHKAMIKRFIGTGPYKFVEFVPDVHIRLARFEDYKGRAEPPNGYGGARVAYFDEILFIPVPDVAVRIAGILTGEYHFAEWIPPDEYERLVADPRVKTVIIKPSGWTTAVFNKKAGLFTNVKLRQAFLAALSMEPIMKAAYGHPDFWRLDPGLMPPESVWWVDDGREFYNQGNPARARQLLAEAGYDGTPVRWLTTMEYPAYYITALVSKEQLEAVGFVIQLEVMDWATLVARRAKPELWDVFSTAFGVVDDPVLLLVLAPHWPGWYESKEMASYLDELRRETDFDKRMAIWRKAHRLFWEDVPAIKYGDYFLLHIHVPALKNFQGMRMAFHWNCWFGK